MPRARRFLLLAALYLGVASSGAWAADPAPVASAADPMGPRGVVEALHGALLDCMQGRCGNDFDARYAYLFERLDQYFDLPFMARVSVSRAWRSLSPEQRASFVDLSRRLSASRYADNFNSFGGQHFETLGEEPAGRDTILVKTEFVQPSDDNVKFDYRLRQSSQGWRIIDVTLDGAISEITLRRSDYSSVIRRQGFPELVEALEKKIAQLAEK